MPSPAHGSPALRLVTVSAPGDQDDGCDPARADSAHNGIDLGLAPRRVRVGLSMAIALGIWGLIVLACVMLLRLFWDVLDAVIG